MGQYCSRKKSVRVLALIRNELLANVGTLEMIDALFKNNETQQLPYYRLHSDVWEAVSSKIEIVKNDELLTKITEEYFTFDMFERTLQLYEDMCLSVSGY